MRLLRNSVRNCSCLFAVAIIGPLLAGCWSQGPKKSRMSQPVSNRPVTQIGLRFDPLRVGDSIREVDFSGTPTPIPSIQTEIKGDGTIRLDFIGDVQADGKTPGELEKAIQANYVPGLLHALECDRHAGGALFLRGRRGQWRSGYRRASIPIHRPDHRDPRHCRGG
jgi:hypothetical protein